MAEFEEAIERLSKNCHDTLEGSINEDTIVIGEVIVAIGMAMLGMHQATNERLERIEMLLININCNEEQDEWK